jgi:subtilisin
MIDHFRRLGSNGRSLRSILAISSALLLLFSNLVSFTGSPSTIFANAFGQTVNGDKASLQSIIDDRTTQSLENAKKLRQVAGERIPNHYIVVLKDKAAPATEVQSSAEEARSQGAVLRHIYEHAIRGYAIRIPNDKVLESILKNPEVDYVQPDVKVKAFSQSLPTGIDRVDGDLSSAKSGDGTGTVDADIAILDTGIDLSHPDLNVYRQTTFVSGTSSGADDDGHGTMVAGVAAAKDDSQGVVGMAPGARLWAVKVLDSNGDGFDSDIIEGIDYITQHANEIDVVNMSFGGDGPDSALHTAIINSVNAGVTYTAAAGNEAADAGSTVPASFPEVIAVSAIVDTDGKCGGLSSTSTTAGKDDTFASFSNYGSVVDIAAPGVLVKTTARGGSTTSFSGTSAATPHVTGAAALYKVGHPGATPSDILNGLRNAGSTPATSCDGKGHGYFTGDRDSIHEPLLYVASSTTSSDTTPPTVVSTNPSSGATGVAVTSSIVATFSEAVQSTTVSTSTFTLKNSAGTSISGTVSLGTDAKTATFKPASSLAASTSYTATVTTGVKDLAGNAMSTAKSWSFTTAAASPPPSSSCDNNLPISGATSSGSQSTFGPTNAIDNNFNTKWYSTFIVNPWIRLDLGTSKSICSVDIAWADGTSRQYSFFISVSGDGTNFNTIFTGKSSGTTTSPQKYSFTETSARYIQITITQSHVGSANSIAQISEIDVFGKTSTSALSASSESNPNSRHNKGSPTENDVVHNNIINHKPIAKDDTFKTKVNTQILATILGNDFDPDGDRLNLISVSHHTKNGGTVTLGNNGSVSVIPAHNFVGLDTFSYTISDGKGKTDEAKVSVIVTQIDKTDKPDTSSQLEDEAAKNQEEGKVQLNNNGPDNNIVLGDNLTRQLIR